MVWPNTGSVLMLQSELIDCYSNHRHLRAGQFGPAMGPASGCSLFNTDYFSCLGNSLSCEDDLLESKVTAGLGRLTVRHSALNGKEELGRLFIVTDMVV